MAKTIQLFKQYKIKAHKLITQALLILIQIFWIGSTMGFSNPVILSPLMELVLIIDKIEDK